MWYVKILINIYIVYIVHKQFAYYFNEFISIYWLSTVIFL